MARAWKEEDISLGFRCPEGATTIGMSICSVCKNFLADCKCAVLGDCPKKYCLDEDRTCPHVDYDKERWNYPKYAELYHLEES